MNRQQALKLQEDWMAKNKVTIIPAVRDEKTYYPVRMRRKSKASRKGARK